MHKTDEGLRTEHLSIIQCWFGCGYGAGGRKKGNCFNSTSSGLEASTWCHKPNIYHLTHTVEKAVEKQIVHIKCLHSTCWIVRLYFTDNIFWLLLGFSSSGGVWWENQKVHDYKSKCFHISERKKSFTKSFPVPFPEPFPDHFSCQRLYMQELLSSVKVLLSATSKRYTGSAPN